MHLVFCRYFKIVLGVKFPFDYLINSFGIFLFRSFKNETVAAINIDRTGTYSQINIKYFHRFTELKQTLLICWIIKVFMVRSLNHFNDCISVVTETCSKVKLSGTTWWQNNKSTTKSTCTLICNSIN